MGKLRRSPLYALKKPLSECRIGLIGTSEVAVKFDPETRKIRSSEEDFRGVYAIPANVRRRSSTAARSRSTATATHLDDVNAYYPVDRLREAVGDGRIGSMPDWFYGAYNNYSQRKVMEQEAPKALNFARRDELDAMIMVPV